MAQVGKWAFIVGLVIAVAAGLGFNQPWIGWVLAVLGLIVGFLNVSDKESHGFLLAVVALIVAVAPAEPFEILPVTIPSWRSGSGTSDSSGCSLRLSAYPTTSQRC